MLLPKFLVLFLNLQYDLLESAGQLLFSFFKNEERGKSGLRRAECQVTPGRREPTASAAEKKPPRHFGAEVRVKWCGKSAPRDW